MSDYIKHLIEKDKATNPVVDINSFDKNGRNNIRCHRCGWMLIYKMEQFCPCCGQRFVENNDDGFRDSRKETV